jgi:hypothetical protein
MGNVFKLFQRRGNWTSYIRNKPVWLQEKNTVGPVDSWNREDIRAGARRTIIGAKKNIKDPTINSMSRT